MARKLIVEIVGDSTSLNKTFKKAEESSTHLDRTLSHTTRGIAAGSGIFRTLGRSLAFASGGFIAAAGAADLVRGSIKQASEAAATQGQLAAQFRASGVSLAQYKDRIDEATNAVSRLAGFEDDQLTQAFTTAFRGSRNVSVALQIQATAADVARGRHIDLQAATLALTKAYGGQATALRRLGILVPANLHGLSALTFVQEKFAGQAAAGTTAQERFSAAFANFEEKIGTALLPTFNKLLDSLGKWLNSTKNQKKVQHDVSAAVSTTSEVLGLGVHAVQGYTLAWDKFAKLMHRIAPGVNQDLLKVQGLTGPVGTPGTPTATGLAPGLRGPLGSQPAKASLTFQLSLLQQRLAQAELTATQKDDRAVLVRIQALTRQKLNQTKDLAKRIDLEHTLGSVQQQIAAIDSKAAADRQELRDKALAAREKEHQQAVAAYQKTKAQADKILAAARARVKSQNEALKAAADVVRGTLGGIFSGPMFGAPAGVLGVSNARGIGATIGAGGFVSNLRQQTAQLVAFNNDLARLARRGAPGGLISQLRQGGIEQGPLIHQLATAGRPTLRSLFRAFAQQEKVVQQIAHADVQAKTVTIVTSNLSGRATTPSTQRRGRQAGVPATIGSYINP